MPSNSPRQNGSPAQPGGSLAGEALPLSNRRLQTLQAMERSIASSANFLDAARNEFQKAKTYSGDALRSQVHSAKTRVNEALELLHGIEHLVELNPRQITRTSSSVKGMVEDIKQIQRVSSRLMTAADERHYPRALAALERRCEQLSKHLTTFVEEEVKTAQREIANPAANTSRALIA